MAARYGAHVQLLSTGGISFRRAIPCFEQRMSAATERNKEKKRKSVSASIKAVKNFLHIAPCLSGGIFFTKCSNRVRISRVGLVGSELG